MTRLLRFAAPLLAVAGTAEFASAGWNNVYQVTCWGCRKRESSYYVAPAPVQSRSSYRLSHYETETRSESVTVMRPERYIEEVATTERRSYYEPQTTYSRSSYYNPVTGCCEVVEKPTTRMIRKEECATVMKPVERLRMVPTQVERQYEVRRPVYVGPEERVYKAPVCALPNAGSGVSPRVEELRSPGPSVNPEAYTPITPPNVPASPGGTSVPRAMPPAKVNARTTSRSGGNTFVRGEVVRPDQATPLAGAKLVLVSADDKSVREFATADEFGRFDLSVPTGTWHLYVGDGNGRANFHKTVKLAETERTFTVVSR
jgi:hypothetical protein